MNWFLLLQHDLRCGLLRWRYPLTAVPTAFFFLLIKYPVPLVFLVSICLVLNFDYLPGDMTNNGQQVLIRCHSRARWYLSKCVWNLCAVGVYFTLLYLSAYLIALCGGRSLDPLSVAFDLMLGPVRGDYSVTLWAGLAATLLIPYLTLAALSLLQMALGMIWGPIISLLICIALAWAAAWFHHPLILGTGLSVANSGILIENGVSPLLSITLAFVTILACVTGGALGFRCTDILSREE